MNEPVRAFDGFQAARREWERIPVDDIGYLNTGELLAMPNDEFLKLMSRAENNRYGGWRNYRNLWKRHLIGGVQGKVVLDFGCGAGIDALQFAQQDNKLVLADINVDSQLVAARLLQLHGYPCDAVMIIGKYPFVSWPRRVDVFYSSGVLHHTPMMPWILERARELIGSSGEIRLMLYTDKAWKITTDTEPPGISDDPRLHPQFAWFVRGMDTVGDYAEPWWEDKLRQVAANRGLTLTAWTYLTPDWRYASARLESA